MVRVVGKVEIDKLELSARCSQCRKTLTYPKNGMRLEMWKELLKSFVKKHKDCDAKTKEEMGERHDYKH